MQLSVTTYIPCNVTFSSLTLGSFVARYIMYFQSCTSFPLRQRDMVFFVYIYTLFTQVSFFFGTHLCKTFVTPTRFHLFLMRWQGWTFLMMMSCVVYLLPTSRSTILVFRVMGLAQSVDFYHTQLKPSRGNWAFGSGAIKVEYRHCDVR